ncbi:two-partner secretion domain-containing protein [Kushneria sp. Sum13]|uniref:two-partner secretion domain-containing protein n=1 Tax=Kushneria sp. Sum13 TaxID=3459196 RepID=UPI00404621D3
MKVQNLAGRLLAHVLINALFWQPVIVLADGITIDGRAGGNTAMDRAGNGVPVVDIATPNGRGLSHNTFSDYNVGKEGVILNNATGKLQSTKLGGMIVGNPNLKGQAAQLIVNEVNGGRASQLKGYTEVAGQAARVVVANPYGITCNGCGFINSPRVTLSTGKPMIEDGALDRFAVDQGQVTIEGLGLDASEVDQFDIVTRAAKLNGELHARELNIVTGRNDVDAASLAATARKSSDDTPALSIDASALGAMYAGSIHLVGTEAGVGVRLAGDMAATVGDITIDTQGHLALTNAAAQRDIAARAASIETQGSQHAHRDARLTAREEMGLYGNLSSGGDTTLTAGTTLTQQGQVIAGIDGDQRIRDRRLDIRADQIDNRGRLEASQTLQARARQLDNRGQLLADEINVHADDAIDNTGTLQARRVRLETAALTNGSRDALIAATEVLSFKAPDISNQGTIQFGKGQTATLDLIKLDNRDGRFLLDDGALDLHAESLFNDRGTLQAESLSLAGRYLTNRAGGLIGAASGNATLVIEQQLDNSGGQLQAAGSLELQGGDVLSRQGQMAANDLAMDVASLDNTDGLISAGKGNATVVTRQQLGNGGGQIQAQKALKMTAGALNNDRGTLVADTVSAAADTLSNRDGTFSAQQGSLDITVAGLLDNDHGRLQSVHQALRLTAGDLSNRQGSLMARLITLGVEHALDNQSGRIVSDGVLTAGIKAALDNTGGTLRGSRVTLETGLLTNNDDGLISADRGDLDITARDRLTNQRGKLQALNAININGGNVDNTGGTLVADQVELRGTSLANDKGIISAEQGPLTLHLSNNLSNVAGQIQARNGALGVDVDGIVDNSTGTIAAKTLTLRADAITSNRGGLMAALADNARVHTLRGLNNDGGQIQAAGLLTLEGTALSSRGGRLLGNTLAISGESLDNSEGGVASAGQGEARLSLSKQLNNDSGNLQAAGALVYRGGEVTNRQGSMLADTLSFEASALDNRHGLMSAEADDVTLTVHQGLDNTEGQLQAQRRIMLKAAGLDNSAGTLLADDVDITTETFANRGGTVAALNGNLTAHLSGRLENDRGQLQAGKGRLEITAGDMSSQQGRLLGQIVTLGVQHAFDGRGGRVESATLLDIAAGEIINNTGGTLRGNRVSLATGRLSSDEGLISADGGDLDITARDRLTNQRGKLQALHALNISGGHIDNGTGTLVADQIDIEGLSLANDEGMISAENGALILKAANHLDNTRGHLQATESAAIHAATLDNHQGTITARDITLTSDGALDNTAGRIVAQQGNLHVKAGGALSNSDGTLAGDALTLEAESLEANQGGLIAALTDSANIRARQTLNNDGGQIQAAGLLDIEAPEITSRAGHLIGHSLTLAGNALDNRAGTISADQGNATLTLTRLLNNTDGRLQADKGTLSLTGAQLTNRQGVVMADRLDIDTADLDNRKGQLISERLNLQADSLDNGEGGLIATGRQGATLTLGSLTNDAGQLQSDGTLDITTATLDNRRGVLLADRLDLNSARLLNDSGSMLADAGGIALTVSGAASNRQGMIDSDGGDITLENGGQAFDNRAGRLNGRALAISTGSLNNQDGGQLSGQQIRFIGLKTLNNAGGRVLAGSDDLAVDAEQLDNRAGVLQGDHVSLIGRQLNNGDNGLIASLNGPLKAVFTQTLDNRNGRMIANGLLDIDPPRVDNRNGQMAGDVVRLEAGTLDNDGGIIEAQKGLALNVDTLNNRSGNLRALGGDSSDLRVAGALDNTRGSIELASRNARIDASSLNNTRGQSVHAGSGLLTLLLKSLNNSGGSLQGTGSAQARIDRINNAGQWQFNGPLSLTTLNALTLSGSDRLASADTFTLAAASLDNRGELLANGNLILKSAGDITNRGLISAQRQLNVTGRNLSQNDGRMASGGTATYSLSGTLDNLGRLTGSDDIDLQAREINNRGTLGSQKNLRLVSQGAINNQTDTLLFAGGDMTLRGTRLYNRYGDLYSRGDLDVARDDNGGYADLLENRSGTIEAEGDIRLRVNSLLNTRDVFEMVQEVSAAYIRRGANYYCKGNCKHVDYTLVEKNSSTIKKDSPAASIVAGGNFDSNGNGAVVNRYSLIEANKNLHINAGSLENTGASAEESTRERKYQGLFGRHHHDERNDTAFNKKEIDPWNAKGGKDSDGQPLPNPLTEENYKSYVRYGRGHLVLLQDKTTRSENGSAAAAIIQAGSRVSINASQRIDNGEINNNKRSQINGRLEGGDPNAPVMELDYTLNRRTNAATALKPAETKRPQREQVSDSVNSTGYLSAEASDGVRPERSVVEHTAEGDGQRVQGERLARTLYETGKGVEAQRSASIALNFTPVDYTGFSFERVSPTQLSSFRLPEGQYGLFVKNKAPDSHYLIETNPEFTSADRLMGSDYLLGKLDYTDDSAYRLLGDGRYEARLIRNAVQAQTGSRFLDDNLKNDYDQYLYLMNNAIAAQDELHLTTGVSLTPSQTAALTHDIVWMEEQEVDGETVLAPVLYLAQVDARNVRGSSLIQGRDIDLIAGSDLASVGTIRAANDLTANSGSSILQGGLMAAGNNLALTVTDNIRNGLAGEIRGRQVDLTTLKGDIVNDRLAVKSGSDRRYDTIIDQGGLISANDNLRLSAGRDLVNRSELVSGGDLKLSAARDLRMAAVEDARGDDSTYGYRRSSQVRQLGSQVTAARDATLTAGRDMKVVASTVEAGHDLAATAGNDIRILSGEDRQHDELHYRSSRTKKDVVNTTTRQQGSQLTAGNNLTLVANNDLTAQASQLRAGDQAYLVGGNDVQLIAANDQDYHFYQKKKKGGLFSSSKMKRDELTDTRAVGTTVDSGGDLTIASGNDQVYQKARLDAGGNLTLSSGGDITFVGAMDTHSESHEKSKSNWAWQSAKGKGNTDETLRQSELVAQGQLAINAANRVHIDVRDIDQQSVSQTIDAMVAAEPELAWLKQAEAQGDVDWRQVKEIHDRWNYKQSGLGEGAALAVSIAAAAVVGPAVGGLAGSGLMGAMATGAAGSLAGSGAVSLINNRGNLGATLGDTLSSDSLKGALIAAASAGVSENLDSVWGGETDPATGRTIPHNLSTWGGTGRFAGQLGSQALADAGLQSAINGGSLNDNLQQSLKGAVSTVLEASLFNQVGNLGERYPEFLADGDSGKTALHALAGGLASQATGGDFRTGAIAAGANEALINQLDALVKGDRKLLIAASQITGIVAAGMTDGDVQKGAEIAGNATAYNWLLHDEIKEADARRKECDNQSCENDITRSMEELDQSRDREAFAYERSVQEDAVLNGFITPEEYNEKLSKYWIDRGIDTNDVVITGYPASKEWGYRWHETFGGATDRAVSWPERTGEQLSGFKIFAAGLPSSATDYVSDLFKYGTEWITSPIPGQSIERGLDNYSTQTPYDFGGNALDYVGNLASGKFEGLLGAVALPGSKNRSNYQINSKLPNGYTVESFENRLSALPAGERVAQVKIMAKDVAEKNNWIKDRKLTKLNSRDVYSSPDGKIYALDSQHGRFERLNRKGVHEGEVDMALNEVPGKKDASGSHDIRIK